MAEMSSSEERQKAGKGSPFDPISAPTGYHANPRHPPTRSRSSRADRPGRGTRPGDAISSKHFTLHAGLASTKKQEFRLAIGLRAGFATARNRAKRQAREMIRLNRHRLPEGIALVISARGNISSLTRRGIRDQLADLFDRARALSLPRGPDGASRQ